MDGTEYKRIDDLGEITPEDQNKYPFLHFCHEWDGMLIDETFPEFDCCICFK